MIEMTELLYGNPSWENVQDFFKNGDFRENEYLIAAIKKYLLTNEQKQIMSTHNFSIQNMLGGQIPHELIPIKTNIYQEWNTKLEVKYFGPFFNP